MLSVRIREEMLIGEKINLIQILHHFAHYVIAFFFFVLTQLCSDNT